MLSALARRIGGWVGRLFGLRDADDDAPTPSGAPEPAEAAPGNVSRARHAAASDEATAADERLTGEPVPEATRRSLVPGWLVAVRTQLFTGLASIGLLLFGGLALLVTGGLTAGADVATTQAVQGIAVPWFGPLMLAVSAFGFPPQAILLVGGIAALFWRAGLRTEARFALLASASVLLTEGIKLSIGRPRPDPSMVSVVEGVGGHSFPSGHTLFYVTFFGFLAYLAYARLKPGRLRTVVLWLTGLLILLVGPSRIWMGQHWVSDVLASYALGLTYLILLVQWYGRRRLAAMSRPAPISAPAD